jgi:beta-glucosidase
MCGCAAALGAAAVLLMLMLPGVAGAATGAPAAGGAASGTASAGSAAGCPWVGSTAPISDRVAEVIASMTTAEKLDVVGGVNSKYVGATTAVPQLCIPALTLEDGPAGVGDSTTAVTQLPAPVALAASWNPTLAFGYGAVAGAEDLAKGVDVNLGPTVNIVRDPRWGRAFETYGEDPYLTGAIGDGYIEGVQSTGVMAQVKHLAAYDEESGRDSTLLSNSIVSERALQEIYLPPFADAVQRAHVASAMCSYNEVNGVPGCQSGYLMTQVLDDEFGFTGFVTSDWYATQSSVPSANAGLDMQMPDACYFSTGIEQGLADGQLAQSQLNEMVSRILTEMFRFGLVRSGAGGAGSGGGAGLDGGSLSAVATSADHRSEALTVAEQGTVLLKNAGPLLPLNPASVGSVAVIGADGGSGAVTGGSGSASVVPSGVVTPLAGIQAAVGAGTRVVYNDGSSVGSAAAAAAGAKVTIVFADLPEGEGEDLPNINLTGDQNALIAAVAAANPHTIVVLNSGSAVAMPWLSSVAGVIEGWYPGQQDGDAIAAVLFGRFDPSGKLPVTFPASLSQVSAAGDWPSLGKQNFSEGIFVGYRWFEEQHEQPLFPFGYGLSYTSFKVSGGHVAATSSNGRLLVRVRVMNTGTRTGSDVVQLYIGDPAVAGEPPQQLKGFDRVTLRPGASRVLRFRLIPQDLSYWDGRWRAPAGVYQLYAGDSSEALPVHLKVRLARTVVSGAAVGPAPVVGRDSPLLQVECPADALAPDVNAVTTLAGDLETNLADLP